MSAVAQFEVREIFRLSTGPSIVFAGRIINGIIRPGMSIEIELQPKLTCSCTVRSVEYIDRVSVGEALVGLLCEETDPSEADVYGELCPPGTLVQIKEQ